jgi:hypothetical protein
VRAFLLGEGSSRARIPKSCGQTARCRAFIVGTLLAVLPASAVGAQLRETEGAAVTSVQAARRVDAAVSDATGLALQGHAASAIEALERVPAADYASEAQVFRDCMVARFSANVEAPLPLGEDPWIASLGGAYVSYWRAALMRPASIEATEDTLAVNVGQILGRPMTKAEELDDAEPDILAAVESHGLHALLGRTSPLRELMLWKTQTALERKVDLPGGREQVKVMLLDDFVLRGWGHYATCGRRSAGGWTTDTALFAVGPAYKNLDDEVFSVRFLGHEAQHFADKRTFPNLESWELEYRAKLVELTLGTDSLPSTLRLFCENRGDSKASPPGYANAKVIRDVAQRSGIGAAKLCGNGKPSVAAIQRASKKLLREDSASRRASSGAPASSRAREAS